MINNLILLQADLQKGMSIEEALQKHNLTFKEAFTELDKYKMGRPHKNKKQKLKKGAYATGERYIRRTLQGHYYLRKQVRGKMRTFGTYHTLEDAVRMREHCKKYGWKELSIDRYCEELGISRCIHPLKRRNKRYS